MSSTTTIKVSKDLRDRITAVARRDHVTIATVIARALDEVETRAFWSAVGRENALLTTEQRGDHVSDAALTDDLADAEDDEVSNRGGW